MIKAILADALGMHLDTFQRILVDPASISIVRYTDDPPVRGHHQLHRATWRRCSPPRKAAGQALADGRSTPDDAPVGGGLGSQEPTPLSRGLG